MNAKIITLTNPGAESGSTIRQSAPMRVHPSMRAESSRSAGMDAK